MPRRDLFDLLILGALWGAAFLFIRIAVPEFGPLALVEVRVALAAVMLFALVAMRRQTGAFRGHWRAFALIGTINTAVPFALYAYATRSVPAGFAAVLNATVPLFGALLGRMSFKESLGPMRALGLGVGFVGVLVLVSRDLSVDGRPLAIAAALSASLLYALSAHLTRRVLPGVPSLVIASGSLIVSAALLAIPAALTWPATMPSLGAWMATLALAVLATGVGYVLYFRLLDSAGATGAMAVTYLIPLFGMIWGGIFLSERVTLPMIIGSACILLGVAITTGVLRPSRYARRAS